MTVIPDISLFVTDSTNRSHIIRMAGSRKSYTIGRGYDENTPASETINIPDQLVSRKHCTLSWTDVGRWLLEDLGSTNGTMVEGAAIVKPSHGYQGLDSIRDVGPLEKAPSTAVMLSVPPFDCAASTSQ